MQLIVKFMCEMLNYLCFELFGNIWENYELEWSRKFSHSTCLQIRLLIRAASRQLLIIIL